MRQLELGGLKVRVVGDGDAGPVVVLLHGFGAPGTDLVPLAGEIAVPPGTRFVFPEAPRALPAEYAGGRCWWMIDVMRMQSAMLTGRLHDLTREVPAGLAEARDAVQAMLAALPDAIGPGPLVIGGFSQGAMLACDVALRSDIALAGLVLMSGTFICEDEWRERMPSREGLHVFQSHGSSDPLLPYAIAERLRDSLVEHGLAVTWVPFSGGHGIAPNVVDRLGDYLCTVL